MRKIQKIISGGQTGVDRGALDAAIKLGIPHGGWCPKGRKAEDGRIPDQYQLTEMATADYPSRTRRNIQEADGTLILSPRPLTGGTLLTWNAAEKLGKTRFCIYFPTERTLLSWLAGAELPVAVLQACGWMLGHQVQILNVAGPRESKCRGVQVFAQAVLTELLGRVEKESV